MMHPEDKPPVQAPVPDAGVELRKLRFEARKFALETLVRIHIDQMAGTRGLVAGHLRLLFGLSIGALASAMTVIGALLRTGILTFSYPDDLPRIILVGLCPVLLTLGAVIALVQSRRTARRAAERLRDPFPASEAEVERLMQVDDADEIAILATLGDVLRARVAGDRTDLPSLVPVTVLILGGLLLGGAGMLLG
ncbi:MAG: hypothetical protein Q27BPR15_04325 [Rhodobacter sp. CACIA14H1]|nr:MAG: hypothetical protein Q27BPR15_04325 [Rhodobacter sp. CACIA14H1]